MPIDAKPQAQPIGQEKGGRGVGLDMEKKGGAHSPIPKFFLKTSLTQVALNFVTVYWPRVQVIQLGIELTR
jgi:hypothetical protein